jgi:hypothetical protein
LRWCGAFFRWRRQLFGSPILAGALVAEEIIRKKSGDGDIRLY